MYSVCHRLLMECAVADKLVLCRFELWDLKAYLNFSSDYRIIDKKIIPWNSFR